MTDALPPAPVGASRRFARGIGTTLLARLGAVVEVAAQPLYVLMFGLAGYGLYAVLWAAVMLLSNVTNLGMATGLQRTIPQAPDRDSEVVALRAALILGLLPCVVAAMLLAIGAEAIAPMINVAPSETATVAPAIRLFAWALPLWALVEISTAALRAKQLFGPEIRLRIMWEQLLRLALAVAFFAAGFGLMALFIAHLLSLAITAGLCWRLLGLHFALDRIRLAVAGPGSTRQSFYAGAATIPNNVVTRLFSDAPPLVLNALLPGAAGASSAALYVIIRKIASLVNLVRIAFAYVVAPVASLAHRDQRHEVAEIYGFAVRLASVIALPLAMALAGAAGPLLALFGPDAHIAAWPLVILLLARAVEAGAGAAQPILQVTGRYRSQISGSLAGVSVAIIAGLMLIPRDPLAGMAVAVSAGFLTASFVPALQLWRDAGLIPAMQGLGRMLVAALGAGLAAAIMLACAANMLPWQAALALLLPVGTAAIWTSMRFGLTEPDRAALGSVARKLRLV